MAPATHFALTPLGDCLQQTPPLGFPLVPPRLRRRGGLTIPACAASGLPADAYAAGGGRRGAPVLRCPAGLRSIRKGGWYLRKTLFYAILTI